MSDPNALTRAQARAGYRRRTGRDVRDYRIGGSITSAGINQALIDASGAGAFGEVTFPGGLVELDAEVTLKQGVALIGGGCHDAATRASTEFRPASGYTGNGFRYPLDGSNSWHYGAMRRMRIRGFTGHGIFIEGGMGETATLDELMVVANGGDGIRIAGPSTPSLFGRLSVHANAGAGMRLVAQTQTSTQILNLAGDNNGESLLTVDGLDPTSSVRLLGWKAERWNNGTPGHPDVFRLNNLNGAFVDLGVGRVQIGSGVSIAPGAIVHQTALPGSSAGRVDWFATVGGAGAATSYTYGYQDDKNGKTLPVSAVTRRQVWGIAPILNATTGGVSQAGGAAETCSRQALVAVTAPVAGTAYAVRISLPDGDFSLLSMATQNTPTGLAGSYFGLYDVDTFTKLAESGDVSADINDAAGLRTIALAMSDVPARDYYLVFLFSSGTLMPVFYGAQIGTSAVAALDPMVCTKHATAGLTALPATLVPTGAPAGLIAPWLRYL